MATKSTKPSKKKIAPAAEAVVAPETKPEVIVESIKGFDANLRCRGFQFEVGQTYEVTGRIEACSNGFHAFPVDEHPLAVFDYYAPTSRFALVSQSGETDKYGNKLASAKITINAEISLGDLTKRAIDWVFARAKWKEGPHVTGENEAATASGTRGAATASGDQGAATASGKASVAIATGWHGRARGVEGAAICLAHRDNYGNIVAIRASKVGESGVKPNVWYSLSADGEFVEESA